MCTPQTLHTVGIWYNQLDRKWVVVDGEVSSSKSVSISVRTTKISIRTYGIVTCINDLEDDITSTVLKFVDDIIFFRKVEDHGDKEN